MKQRKNWLLQKKRNVERKNRQEEHQQLVGRMMTSPEGEAGFLHRITKTSVERTAAGRREEDVRRIIGSW